MKKTLLALFSVLAGMAFSADIKIGNGALLSATDSANNIAIGDGALANVEYAEGNVAIGHNEMASTIGLRNSTSINKRQFFANKDANAFAINPTQEESMTNAAIWCIDGELHLNVKSIKSRANVFSGRGDYPHYDLYLSPFGDDGNSGQSIFAPKKTIDGCYTEAETMTGAVFSVCVFAGEYEPPYTFGYTTPHGDLPSGTQAHKALQFYALEGNEKTFIVGELTEHEEGRGHHNALAFDTYVTYYHYFEGFTIKGLDNLYPAGQSQGLSSRGRMALGLCYFKDCIFTSVGTNDTQTVYNGAWGIANSCIFDKCKMDSYELRHYDALGSQIAFLDCQFYDCEFTNISLTKPSDWYYSVFGFNTVISNCVWHILDYTGNDSIRGRANGSENNIFIYNSTLLDPQSLLGGAYKRSVFYFDARTHGENCYVCGNYGIHGTNYVDCVYGDYTNTMLNAEWRASTIACPAVRIDGRNDAGCYDSGLAAKKILNTRADVRLIENTLWLYNNGVKVGTIDYIPYTEPVFSAYMSAPTPPPQAETQEAEEGSNTIKRLSVQLRR